MSAGIEPIERRGVIASSLFGLSMSARQADAQADPLPSWTDGAVKAAILDFFLSRHCRAMDSDGEASEI